MAARFLSITAALATIASAAPAGGDGCLPFCQSAFNACNAGATTLGNPNHPLCASWFSQCLGYNPYSNNGQYVAPTACADVTAAPPIPTSSGDPDACATACLAAYQSCSGDPGACAYQVSACLGQSPFYNGLYVAPAACSPNKEAAQSTASAAATASGNAAVTTVVTGYTTYCAGPTSIVHGNKTITVTGATTLTVTDCPCTITTGGPAPPAPQPTSCLDKCNAAHVACQNAPGANMATCAAQYAGCLGYNPWGSGSYVAPTACSTTAAAPTATQVVVAGAGRVVPGALAALGALALL